MTFLLRNLIIYLVKGYLPCSNILDLGDNSMKENKPCLCGISIQVGNVRQQTK